MGRGALSDDKKADVVQMIQAGMGAKAVAVELELAVSTVYKVLTESGVSLVKQYAPTSFKKLSDEEISEFVGRYLEMEPIMKLLDAYNLTHTQMYQLLAHLGVEPRTKQSGHVSARMKARDHAVDLYANTDLTLVEIFAETGVHQPTLNREIRLRGVPLRKPRLDYSSLVTPDPE